MLACSCLMDVAKSADRIRSRVFSRWEFNYKLYYRTTIYTGVGAADCIWAVTSRRSFSQMNVRGELNVTTFCKSFVFLAVALAANTLSAWDVIDLFPGDEIVDDTVIESGTTVNVLGGSIGLGVDLANGVLNVESGFVAIGANDIPTGFTNSNNTVNVSGGNVGGFFQLTNGTELDVSGGQLESFGVFSGSSANITGGVVTRFPDIFSSGTVNISGGDVFAVRVFSGGEVNFFGSEFALDGVPLDLVLGQEFVINDRNVTLTGTLSDGSFIETSLNTTFGNFSGNNPDGAAAGALVTVTRTAIPEPSSALLLGMVALPLLARRRNRQAIQY